MQFERREFESSPIDPRVKLRAEFCLQGTRILLRHLVLDGYVRARIVEVLFRQTAVEMLGYQPAKASKFGRFETDRRALAEIKQPGDASFGWSEFSDDLRKE